MVRNGIYIVFDALLHFYVSASADMILNKFRIKIANIQRRTNIKRRKNKRLWNSVLH